MQVHRFFTKANDLGRRSWPTSAFGVAQPQNSKPNREDAYNHHKAKKKNDDDDRAAAESQKSTRVVDQCQINNLAWAGVAAEVGQV